MCARLCTFVFEILGKGRSYIAQQKGYNIYTRLKPSDFPFADMSSGGQGKQKVTDVVVFVVGGTTYEEVAAVHQLNERYQG